MSHDPLPAPLCTACLLPIVGRVIKHPAIPALTHPGACNVKIGQIYRQRALLAVGPTKRQIAKAAGLVAAVAAVAAEP